MGRQIFTAEQFKLAIPKSGGLFTTIAKRVGCTRYTAEARIMGSSVLRQLWRDETETILDVAESEAWKLVQAGDSGMIRFVLATKGRGRGYGASLEVSGPDKGPIAVTLVDYRANITDGDE